MFSFAKDSTVRLCVPKKRLFEVEITQTVLVYADSPEEAKKADLSTDAGMDTYYIANEVQYIPEGWGGALPFKSKFDTDKEELTVNELVDMGKAPFLLSK